MGQPETIELNVSREGVIASMRDSFSTRETFIKELMQNARRAGAGGVWMSVDDASQSLTIIDDGEGIGDPQTLLRLGESGWDCVEVMERENPFGVGFAAAIFAAEQIDVESRDWRIDTLTSALLALEPIPIQTGLEHRTGTRITVTMTDEVWAHLRDRLGSLIENLAWAFPIPVYLDGEPLDRPHALDNIATEDLGIGAVKPIYQDNKLVTQDYCCYYQGFLVEILDATYSQSSRFKWPNRHSGVVHLDSTAFRARMPDRDCLVDANDARERIAGGIRSHLTDYLRDRERTLDADTFVREHSKDAIALEPTLLGDKPLSPLFYGYITALPCDSEFNDYIEHASLQSGELLRHGRPLIDEIDFDEWFNEGGCLDEVGNNVILAYAQALGWPMLRHRDRVGEIGHSALDEAIDLSSLAVSGGLSVSINGGQSKRLLDGRYIFTGVVFCESYTVTPGDERLPTLTITDTPFIENGNAIIPKDVNDADLKSLLLQFSIYMDECDQFDEDALDDDCCCARRLHTLAFSGDRADFLSQTIRHPVRAAREELANRTFTVTIDEKGEPQVIEH